jgi:anti-sigma-K factor RskA
VHGVTAEERDRLAAEHVLGLLDAADSALAERLETRDPAFAGAVAAWRERFAEFDATTPAEPLPDGLWRRVERGLAAPVAVTVTPSRLGLLWRNLAFWRATGLATAIATLVLAVGAGLLWQQRATTPVFVAILVTDGNRPAAVVNAFADGRAELVPLDAIAVPPGRALEIWTLWDRARGPVSIGLLDQARSVRLRVEDLPRTRPDQLFEITLEPQTGSPIGRPTGPILMKGNAVRAL